ncbi:MAG: phosphomannomutase [Halothiobacillaceae bacterium]|nr:phosphomannomutase [Halothiobacillaceae bacterium]
MNQLNDTFYVHDIAKTSSVAFGTSGARGLVTSMTDAVCFIYTAGFLQYMAALGQFKPGMAVAIAGDLRPSSPRIMRACAAAVQAAGGVVAYAGLVPSPAVSLYGFSRQIPSLMITGSHIPDDRNGIKFNRADGELLKSDEAGVLGQAVLLPEGWFDLAGALIHTLDLGEPVDVVSAYVARYVDFFGTQALAGKTIGVYEHSAVGRDVLTTVFKALGANTISLGRSAAFMPVDTEAVRPEDVALAAQWAQEFAFDALVSTDGDSDRPLLSDEHGQWLRGDVLGILTAQALQAAVVATPVSSNTALEKTGAFNTVLRTRIGSPYVIDAMNTALAKGESGVCGFEANGGFLLASDFMHDGRVLAALPTRDALLPMIATLVLAKAQGMRLSKLVATLPPRFAASDRIKAFAPDRSQALLAPFMRGDETALAAFEAQFGGLVGAKPVRVDLTDGVRITCSNDEIVHLRPSGNAPELRCYTEADSLLRAQTLCQEVLAALA